MGPKRVTKRTPAKKAAITTPSSPPSPTTPTPMRTRSTPGKGLNGFASSSAARPSTASGSARIRAKTSMKAPKKVSARTTPAQRARPQERLTSYHQEDMEDDESCDDDCGDSSADGSSLPRGRQRAVQFDLQHKGAHAKVADPFAIFNLAPVVVAGPAADWDDFEKHTYRYQNALALLEEVEAAAAEATERLGTLSQLGAKYFEAVDKALKQNQILGIRIRKGLRGDDLTVSFCKMLQDQTQVWHDLIHGEQGTDGSETSEASELSEDEAGEDDEEDDGMEMDEDRVEGSDSSESDGAKRTSESAGEGH